MGKHRRGDTPVAPRIPNNAPPQGTRKLLRAERFRGMGFQLEILSEAEGPMQTRPEGPCYGDSFVAWESTGVGTRRWHPEYRTMHRRRAPASCCGRNDFVAMGFQLEILSEAEGPMETRPGTSCYVKGPSTGERPSYFKGRGRRWNSCRLAGRASNSIERQQSCPKRAHATGWSACWSSSGR